MAIGALIASTVLSIGAQVFSGIQASKAAKREASFQRQQATLAQQESEIEAERVELENRKFKKRQKIAFLKSGVTLLGSPLLVLDETERESQKQVQSILRRGTAQFRLGLQRADITRRRGRAALIGGIAGAASTALSSFSAGASLGLFSPKSTGQIGGQQKIKITSPA